MPLVAERAVKSPRSVFLPPQQSSKKAQSCPSTPLRADQRLVPSRSASTIQNLTPGHYAVWRKTFLAGRRGKASSVFSPPIRSAETSGHLIHARLQTFRQPVPLQKRCPSRRRGYLEGTATFAECRQPKKLEAGERTSPSNALEAPSLGKKRLPKSEPAVFYFRHCGPSGEQKMGASFFFGGKQTTRTATAR